MRIVVLAAALMVVASALGAPPPITDAEKAACELLSAYLSEGPDALVRRLATTSPWHALPAQAARSELQARLGPADGATWELRTTSDDFARHGAVFMVYFSSGLEDVVAFDLTRESDEWKLKEVRTLVDVNAAAPASAKSKGLSPAANAPRSKPLNLLWFLIGAPILTIAAALGRRSRPGLTSAALLVALAMFAVPVAETIDPHWVRHLRGYGKKATATAAQPSGAITLAPLTGIRRALAFGEKPLLSSSLGATQREAAALWIAAFEHGGLTVEDVRTRLESNQILTNAPMAVLLRARLAARDGKDADAMREYRSLNTAFVPSDAFDLESRYVGEGAKQPAEPRSRDASLYYLRSIEAIVGDDLDAARQSFRAAWRLRPITRRDVIEAKVFAFLLADPSFAILLNVNTPDEQKLVPARLSHSPMQVPRETRSSASGDFVRLTIGSCRLDIPGGASIAPRGTAILSAVELEREDTEAALNAVSRGSARNFASAYEQRVAADAAEALARHNRWDQILKLTDSITPQSDNIPDSLILWRMRALARAHRGADVKALATGRAMTTALQRSPDVATLIESSSLLAQGGAWFDASQMLLRVSTVKDAPDVGHLLRRVELRQQLSDSPPVLTTEHFEIHMTPGIPSTVAERIGQLLEAELVRVSGFLRTSSFSRVRVNVVGWEDFSARLTFSGDVLGFYDGEITIPFGEVSHFREFVVSILTHELTHAIVAQATADNAPRWFQEGIAKRMELQERKDNIFDLQPGQDFVALDLLDATLASSIDGNAVAQAYLIGQTVMYFLEQRYGSDAIPRLIEQFQKGHDTSEALRAVTGKSVADLDREFRTWGLTHAGAFLDDTRWPYAEYDSLDIDPAIRNAIRFSRRKP